MAAYNILETEIKCNNCGNNTTIKLQFKFGDTWQFQYRINDKIRWGGNDIGIPNLSLVKVYGLAESEICTFCKHPNSNEYDIIIENDFIRGVNQMDSYECYLLNNGDYCVMKE